MSDAALKLIRTTIFKIRQDEMAGIADTSQATVSRWEKGDLVPDLQQMSAIRAEARSRGIKWKDDWFFNATAIPQ